MHPTMMVMFMDANKAAERRRRARPSRPNTERQRTRIFGGERH